MKSIVYAFIFCTFQAEAQIKIPAVEKIEVSKSEVVSRGLKSQTFGVDIACRQGSYIPSCSDVRCRTETKEECSTKTIEICDEYGRNCRTRTEKECGPVSREVCTSPNPCDPSGGGHWSEICEEVNSGHLVLESILKLKLNIQTVHPLLSPVILSAELSEKNLQLTAEDASTANPSLVVSKTISETITKDEDKYFEAEKEIQIVTMSVNELQPRLRFERLDREGLVVVNDRSASGLKLLPTQVKLSVFSKDREKTHFSKILSYPEYRINEQGSLEIEFWRVQGFKLKKRTIVRVDLTFEKNETIQQIQQKVGEGALVINPEVVSAKLLDAYYEEKY